MQALLLSTLSLADEDDDDEDEPNDTDERITSATGDDDILNIVSPSSNTTSCDSITPTGPRDEYETKKQQESASHSEYDSQQPPRGATTKPSQSQAKPSKAASDRSRSNVHANSQQSATQAPAAQQKTARELKATSKEVLPGDTR